jgi:DHA2 family multidrug resistance protein
MSGAATLDQNADAWRPAVNPWIIASPSRWRRSWKCSTLPSPTLLCRTSPEAFLPGQDESTWVLTSYLVSNAIVLPLSGWLSSIMGRKNFYMGCVALFTVSSFLCGLAPNLATLIICRILQGAGGGGLQPSEQAILADTFPLRRSAAWRLRFTEWRW